ncbi:hypothetical protein PhaeoP18_03461 [Phaeobacter piscinae]|uniref:Uncharacterized protein n=1 Tax=Phaeobacter piscinae TaxID=1580596 RepID=A0AAN1GUH3_9RHOB|nr:hypothetical protein PhaeoP13_03483 [Phaeobacter piscinae]AUR37679.1 hypothetical protein PhaeoP18_03461 [Phaeobacter piscinae]
MSELLALPGSSTLPQYQRKRADASACPFHISKRDAADCVATACEQDYLSRN